MHVGIVYDGKPRDFGLGIGEVIDIDGREVGSRC